MIHEIRLIHPPTVECTCGAKFTLDFKYPLNWEVGCMDMQDVHKAHAKEQYELRFKQETSGE